LVLAGLAVLCGGAVCAGAVVLVPAALDLGGCVSATAPATSAVRTDTARVRELLPGLGAFDGVHWQAREVRPRTCPDFGPMDYVYEGAVVLAAATAQAYRQGYRWTPAVPQVTPELRPFAPAEARWMGSAELTRQVVADRGEVAIDLDSGTLHFVYRTD
jgi:hypothetical protein